MVGALIVLFVVVVGWVAVRAVFTPEPARRVQTIDYQRVVPAARKAAPFDLVAPASLPRGWRATTAGYTDGAGARWHLGVLTDAGRYVGLEQGGQSVRSIVAEYVDPAATRGRPVDVGGVPWTTYTDTGGDLALARHQGRTTTLVVGHDVDRATLVSYTQSLR